MRLKISMTVHIFAKFYRHVLLFVECLFNIDNITCQTYSKNNKNIFQRDNTWNINAIFPFQLQK